ncbi:hypothetical protein CN918_27650 [Priestia megaterium]|nr:hypothetical protein CN918_27650 [Priestia megaterium]
MINLDVASANGVLTPVTGISGSVQSQETSGDFLKEFWDVIQTMDTTQKSAQQKVQDVMTNKSDDTHGALIAEEKASLQLEIATTIRDRAVSAFNKLMDTQI